jgi:hydrogenase nickel incorporation protein HypB
MKIIPMSAKTGEGIDEWSDWLRDEISRFHTENARLDA